MSDSSRALLFTEQDMEDQQLLAFPGGRVAVFTTRSPDKDGPNEDAAGLLPCAPDRGVLVVADGVGGRRAGESASYVALDCLRSAVAAVGAAEESLRPAILDGVERANHRLLAQGTGAGTTLAIAELAGGSLRPYHVGDSMVLVVGQRGKVKLQTTLHSPTGYGLEAGLLDEDEALHHEQRHLISNMVGATDMRIEVGSARRLAPRDTVLLATDGLLDNMGLAEIVDAIRIGPLREAARELRRTALERMRHEVAGQPSKPDDISFLLYRLEA